MRPLNQHEFRPGKLHLLMPVGSLIYLSQHPSRTLLDPSIGPISALGQYEKAIRQNDRLTSGTQGISGVSGVHARKRASRGKNPCSNGIGPANASKTGAGEVGTIRLCRGESAPRSRIRRIRSSTGTIERESFTLSPRTNAKFTHLGRTPEAPGTNLTNSRTRQRFRNGLPIDVQTI